MKTVSVNIFSFDELSEKAKERAREWLRETDTFDPDTILEECKESIGPMLGFNVQDIFYHGFWSQGDGACFTGTWYARDVRAAALQKYAPKDARLADIRKRMRAFARKHRTNTAVLTRNGYGYSHEGSISVEAYFDSDGLAEIARDFMRWIYRALEAEYEYQYSDEHVDEGIRANEYTFLASGERSRW